VLGDVVYDAGGEVEAVAEEDEAVENIGGWCCCRGGPSGGSHLRSHRRRGSGARGDYGVPC
jgi:hypothetical protein